MSLVRGLIFASIAALAACYSPHYENCEVTCATNNGCPSGLECDMALGRCHTPGGSCSPQDDSGTADTDGDVPYPTGMWSAPVMLNLTTTASDPTLTADMLQMWVSFSSDIYVTTRSSTADAWSPLVKVAELSSPNTDAAIRVSSDGLTMIVSTDRNPTSGSLDLQVATRPSRTATWSLLMPASGVNSPSQDASAWMSDDQLTLYFGSLRINNNTDIFKATRTLAVNDWDMPTVVSELRPASHPCLSPDERTIYFHSSLLGTLDLFIATRASPSDMFGTPTPITELNTGQSDDQDPWVSPDGHHMFFTRATGATGNRIFETKR